MQFHIETERLILREVQHNDVEGFLALNSNPKVQKFVGGKSIKTVDEARENIEFIINQYQNLGIGRWTVVDKKTNEFLGWSGLKLIDYEVNGHINFYELGYRFIPKFWGKGYATETARASINYAFETLNVETLFAITDCRNHESTHVLSKIGFNCIEIFNYEGNPHNWFSLNNNKL